MKLHNIEIDHSWVDLDIHALRHNIELLGGMAQSKSKAYMLMVKANAYGHGLVEIASLMQKTDIQYLGVGHIQEALLLRQSKITSPILLFTEPPVEAIPLLYRHKITVIVSSIYFLRQLLDTEMMLLPLFHIKINTGLNRFGLQYDEISKACQLLAIKGATPEGILTHYSSAADNPSQTEKESALFQAALQLFKNTGQRPRFIHASNSAATAWHTEPYTNLVRLGLAAYGLQPNPERPLPLRPVMSWHTRLVAIRKISADEKVGYGGSWAARRESTIGVIPVGYSDGLRRGPKHQKFVLLHEQHFPLLSVMMNHAIIDLTDAQYTPHIGNMVTLLGKQGGKALLAEDIADALGTINEEVATTVSPLLPRRFDPKSI